MRYGFIGLGSQGAPMAQRMIEAGLDVVLWARRAETLAPYAQQSITFATSIAELGSQVQHCGICVVDDQGVEAVCEELFPSMAPGGSIAIHSTVHPQLCRTLAEQAAGYQLVLVDAPVSGGSVAAAAGKLTVMVGGSEAAFELMRPVFETFSGLLIHLGDIGTGQMAKLINNSMMAANLAIAHDSFEAAKTLGLDRAAYSQLIKASSGHSFAFDVRDRMQEPTQFEHGAKMLNKDVRLLGEILGEHSSFRSIRNVAHSFIRKALLDQS